MDIPLAETGLKGSLSWSRGQSQSCCECAAVNGWPHSWPYAWKVFTSEQHHKSSTARNYIKGFFSLHFIDLSKKNPKLELWLVVVKVPDWLVDWSCFDWSIHRYLSKMIGEDVILKCWRRFELSLKDHLVVELVLVGHKSCFSNFLNFSS